MCHESFKKVAAAIRSAVDSHGGTMVATRQEVEEFLSDELRGEVNESAVKLFPLCLKTQSVGIYPYAETGGAVIVLHCIEKYPDPKKVPVSGKMHVLPDARFYLKELKSTSPATA